MDPSIALAALSLLITMYLYIYTELSKIKEGLLNSLRFGLSISEDGKIKKDYLETMQLMDETTILDGEKMIISDKPFANQRRSIMRAYRKKTSKIQRYMNGMILNLIICTAILMHFLIVSSPIISVEIAYKYVILSLLILIWIFVRARNLASTSFAQPVHNVENFYKNQS